MEIFKEILDTHTKICTCRKIYNINEDLEITVDQKENKVVMWGFNHKSDRFLNLSTKRFQKLMDGFKSVASDLYSSGNYYYITVDTSKKNRTGIYETLKYLSKNGKFKKGILAEFLYVGMQVAIWSFTIRLALTLDHSINERMAADFMVMSFACFFIGKFVANFLMTKFSVNKVLVVYSVIGCMLILYISFVPSFTAVYAAVAMSILMGPCWATIYAETLKSVEEKYTETAGAILVMAIIGAACVPAIQGLVSDMLGSMQLSFIVNFFCFAYVGGYFYKKMKSE